MATTIQIVDAGEIIGISVLDHIIITKKGYLSLKEMGFMRPGGYKQCGIQKAG
ncbi:MAG: hypothetical protein L6247_07135 [Desulfobacteraceae bacterium]|nr:hypothetical protein [Desulfobacteraceae bacterium]